MTGYEDLRRLGDFPVERRAELCDVLADTVARIGCESESTQRSLLRLGVGGQRHLGPDRLPHACRSARARGLVAPRERRPSYIPTTTVAAVTASAAIAVPASAARLAGRARSRATRPWPVGRTVLDRGLRKPWIA